MIHMIYKINYFSFSSELGGKDVQRRVDLGGFIWGLGKIQAGESSWRFEQI